jgi:hypothetical protein
VTGAARPGFFHIGHGVPDFLPEIENGVMADPAVVAVFFQMVIVAEDDWFGILKGEGYVLRLLCRGDSREQQDER